MFFIIVTDEQKDNDSDNDYPKRAIIKQVTKTVHHF